MRTRLLRSSFVAITLNLILVISSQALAQCKSLSTADKAKLFKGQSLSIRLFSTDNPYLYRTDTGKPFYTAEPVENLRLSFAERLRDDLLKLKFFDSIVVLRDDQPAQTDMVLEGEFTAIFQLGGKIQLMAYPVTRMGIKGSMNMREAGQKVLEFSCQSASEAGFINRPKKQMHKNIRKISEGVKKLIENSSS